MMSNILTGLSVVVTGWSPPMWSVEGTLLCALYIKSFCSLTERINYTPLPHEVLIRISIDLHGQA